MMPVSNVKAPKLIADNPNSLSLSEKPLKNSSENLRKNKIILTNFTAAGAVKIGSLKSKKNC